MVTVIEIEGPRVRVGDDLVDWGNRLHRVERVESYVGTMIDNGTFHSDTRVAHCEDGYATTLGGDTDYRVVQRDYHMGAQA